MLTSRETEKGPEEGPPRQAERAMQWALRALRLIIRTPDHTIFWMAGRTDAGKNTGANKIDGVWEGVICRNHLTRTWKEWSYLDLRPSSSRSERLDSRLVPVRSEDHLQSDAAPKSVELSMLKPRSLENDAGSEEGQVRESHVSEGGRRQATIFWATLRSTRKPGEHALRFWA